MRTWLRCLTAAVLVATLGVFGCGAGGGKVKGKVTYNGEPLADATVSLMPADNPMQGTVTTTTKQDGTFEIPLRRKDELKPGKYRVVVSKKVKKDGTVISPDDPEFQMVGAPTDTKTIRELVPQDKYGPDSQNPLTVDFKGPGTDLPTFELTGPKIK